MFRKPDGRVPLAAAMVAIVALVVAAVAWADNVTNDVTAGGNDTIVAGGSTTINYKIVATGGDGQAGCNVTDGSPATVTINAPAGVTATPSSRTFSTCGTAQTVAFSSSTPGDYAISASVSDSGTGAYNTTPAKWTLHVNPPPDTTPPEVSANVAPAPNLAGWNNSTPVSLTWSYSDDESTASVVSGCVDEVFSAETAGETRSCEVSSDGGSTMKSVTVKIDETKPVITSDTNGYTPGTWTNQDVAVSFACDDTGSVQSGIATDTVAGATLMGSGADQSVTNSGDCTDVAGNSADSVTVSDIDIDKDKPVNAVTGVADGAVYQLGSVPTAGCTTDDDLSGVATSATVSTTGGTSNGVGTFVAKCSGGSDNAGNAADDATATYAVHYSLAPVSILQPINSDATSLFSRGKSVPVKFRLPGDELTGFDTSGWSVKKVSGTCPIGAGTFSETGEQTSLSTSAAGLRYDAGADQYIYNADFRSDAVGTCWKARVYLDDGTHLDSAVFKLQK